MNNQKKEILKFLKTFLFVDSFILLYFLIFENKVWFLNTQIAFISSFIIISSSFFSYKNNIKIRLKSYEDDKNINNIDKIEDPFDLYSNNIEKEDNIFKHNQELKSKNSIKNTFKNTLLSSSGFLSFYRIISYFILIFCFFALNNNQMFMPLAFLIGLSIVPFGILLSRIFK